MQSRDKPEQTTQFKASFLDFLTVVQATCERLCDALRSPLRRRASYCHKTNDALVIYEPLPGFGSLTSSCGEITFTHCSALLLTGWIDIVNDDPPPLFRTAGCMGRGWPCDVGFRDAYGISSAVSTASKRSDVPPR